LHAKYTKGAIVKALEKLIEDQSVISKTYGKTIIYAVKQNTNDIPSAAEIEEIERSAATLVEKNEELLDENKKLEHCKITIIGLKLHVSLTCLCNSIECYN
jgi:26S proteasome regulatory subunit (ATPase 3-interacting protein)